MDTHRPEWKTVRYKNKKYPDNNTIKIIKKYWRGFSSDGTERWYIELTDGRIIQSSEIEFSKWLSKDFS